MTLSTNEQTTAGVAEQVLRFVEQHTKQTWAQDTDLFASGGVSSLFALQLVMALEKTFGIAIAGEDLKLDNFRTVNAMATLVRRLRNEENGE